MVESHGDERNDRKEDAEDLAGHGVGGQRQPHAQKHTSQLQSTPRRKICQALSCSALVSAIVASRS
jgi:hypothetical protein